ncbi:methyl-CpG-binding domain protein 3-like 2B [Rattus norvegicus]|uniref:methyl-CpG-binding domain protein 3-like 2B n=1 Tax=Rattus norvegicus TaxID=10116 RepID=UPI00005040B9|nr:methyl-CpG-binding domain protein 3-like 2B [Rattus norvegicus]|eukprot:XP_002729925.1 PREDICTED: putative methyl-CpG-binding domain protein 3-like 3 [Rattus norvegicus]
MEESSGNAVKSQPLQGRLTGSMIPSRLQKRRKIQVAKSKRKAKHRSGTTLRNPLRLTSCIFPQPVTLITSYPENKTRYRRDEAKLKKPQQLCALERLKNFQFGGDSKENLSCPLELANAVERIARGRQDEASNQSGDKDQLTSGQVTSDQPPYLETTEHVALQLSPSFSSQGVTLPVPLHLSPSYFLRKVTTGDIQRQAWKVKKARKRLAEALEADRLARQTESMRE